MGSTSETEELGPEVKITIEEIAEKVIAGEDDPRLRWGWDAGGSEC